MAWRAIISLHVYGYQNRTTGCILSLAFTAFLSFRALLVRVMLIPSTILVALLLWYTPYVHDNPWPVNSVIKCRLTELVFPQNSGIYSLGRVMALF